MNSFDFDELHSFVQTMEGIKELPHISEFAGKVAVLKAARLIRQNQRHFNNAYYRSLLNLAEEGGDLSSSNSHQAKLGIREKMFSIEGRIVDALESFRLLVQSLVISKEDQL